MIIDYRKLLKDCIRGMVVDWDTPAVPTASFNCDLDGKEMTREELELFFDLVAEVMSEVGETRQSVLDNVARLERDYLLPSKRTFK